MTSNNCRKYQKGSSGPFADSYHELLGKTQWIFARRLLPPVAPSTISSHEKGPVLKNTPPIPVSSPPCVSEGDIATVFSQFGEVEDVRLVRHPKSGKFLGTAYVKFSDYRSSIAASNDLNSNFETGELCVLYPRIPNASGIVVERCQEVEVPPLGVGGQTYAEWLQQCRRSDPLNDTSFEEEMPSER